MADCNKTLDELRELLAPSGVMNATAVCGLEMARGVLCTRMCDRENVCTCGAIYCQPHAKCVLYDCNECDDKVCPACRSNDYDNICGACYSAFMSSDSDGEL